MMKRMNILLCNDDGIQAPGIRALHDTIHDLGATTVIAPDRERSAISHGITLAKPLYSRPWPNAENPFGTAVSGTPADCIKLSVSFLLDTRPDLVLSGINLGPNAGISVLYSGTVAAASEGAIMGIPAMAISLDTFHEPLWDTAARVARHLVQQAASGALPIPPGVFLNVNVPNRPYADLAGLRLTTMGASRFIEKYEQRFDPWGNPYYWTSGDLADMGDSNGTDLDALRNGYVSVSPIQSDRTCRISMETLAGALPPLPA